MLLSNIELVTQIKGKPLKEYYHDGNWFIEGRKKSEFSLLIRNLSYMKIKAILSVDGLSVIDGTPAGENSQGYIVDGRSELVVDGWRTSNSTINKFVFSGKRKSYNAKMNEDTRNVGVIGLMVFSEKVQIQYPTAFTLTTKGPDWGTAIPTNNWNGSTRGFGTSNLVGQNSIQALAVNHTVTQNIGAGFGDEKTSHAYEDHYTKFEKTPVEIMSLYYDDREGLERRGIVINQSKSFPNAFPNYTTSKFARRPLK